MEISTMHEQALFELIMKMLTLPKAPNDELTEQAFSDDPEFRKLYDQILAIRELSYTLSKGNLENQINEKGFVLSNMKALQANLRHLTWQTKKIAEGDYSQQVDYLGDFSDAFNLMTSTLKVATNQLKDIARLDNLTKIPNRLSLDEFLTHAFSIAKNERKNLFVFMYDIDYFKKVNDTYGHAAGDQVLIHFSEIVSKQFRSTDIFARYGGEEFVAVLPDIQLENAMQIGERSLRSIENTDFVIDDNISIKITVSIGLSNIRPEDMSYEDILKRSDAALYDAKHGGRDRLCVLL